MKRWTIYCHTHVESGRRYVGLTSKTMLARWNDHVCKAKFSKNGRWHFPNAIRKYGKDAFSHEVLEVCHDVEVANLAEECWIELLDTRNPEKGFNLAKGGLHVPHPIRRNPWDNPKYRARQVEAGKAWSQTPRARAIYLQNGRGTRGRLPSEETKAQIAATVSKSNKRVMEARRRGMTHYVCKTHGPVLLRDCYIKYNIPGGLPIYTCKKCVELRTRARRAAARVSCA